MFNKLKKLFKSSKSSQLGVVQLPIIIGLLIVGIALPAAVTLVQRTQETRRGATDIGDIFCHVSCTTNPSADYAGGYCRSRLLDCNGGDVSTGENCAGILGASRCCCEPVLTGTPQPTATATIIPTATATPTPMPTSCSSGGTTGPSCTALNCCSGTSCEPSSVAGFYVCKTCASSGATGFSCSILNCCPGTNCVATGTAGIWECRACSSAGATGSNCSNLNCCPGTTCQPSSVAGFYECKGGGLSTPTPTSAAPRPTATPTPIPQEDTLWCNPAVQAGCNVCLECKWQAANPGGWMNCGTGSTAGCSKSGGITCVGMCSANTSNTLGCSAVNGSDRITSASARVSYGQAINACAYFFEYREKGESGWSDSLAFVRGADMWDGNHYGYALTGLKPGTEYEWRAITENDDCTNSPKYCPGQLQTPFSFKTLCPAPPTVEMVGMEWPIESSQYTRRFTIADNPGGGCYPKEAMIVVKKDVNQDGIPDDAVGQPQQGQGAKVAGGVFKEDGFVERGSIFSETFILPGEGHYVWRGRARNSIENDPDRQWSDGEPWQKLNLSGGITDEPIIAVCEGDRVSISPANEAVTEGEQVVYSLGAGAYGGSWTRAIRYKYEEGGLTPGNTFLCTSDSDTCQIIAAGADADDPGTAALEGGSKLWIFTNLSKDVNGTTYWCRFDGQWVHWENDQQVVGPAPNNHSETKCMNSCTVNLQVRPGCPRGDEGNLDCDSGGIIGNEDLNIMLTCMFKDSSLAACQALNPAARRSANITGADNEVNERDLTRLLYFWSRDAVLMLAIRFNEE